MSTLVKKERLLITLSVILLSLNARGMSLDLILTAKKRGGRDMDIVSALLVLIEGLITGLTV